MGAKFVGCGLAGYGSTGGRTQPLRHSLLNRALQCDGDILCIDNVLMFCAMGIGWREETKLEAYVGSTCKDRT